MLQNQLNSPITMDLAEDARWLAVLRIVDSPHFKKSPRLSQLLLYLSEQTLLERSDLLSEHTIAMRVFERNASFDPGVDTIVRSHMVRLRQKLDRYAEEDGGAPSILVSIPRGEYLVRFETLAFPLREIERAGSPHEEAAAPGSAKPFLILGGVFGLLSIMLIAAVLVLLHRSSDKVRAAVQPPHPLWSRIFQAHEPTTFVAADSGLVLLHRMTAKNTTLAEYLARDFSQETRGIPQKRTDEVLDMANRRYTSFVDLNLFQSVEHLSFASVAPELKYARDLHMDDLKRGNFIFSGARGANPWLELYEPEMNFVGSSNGGHHSYTFLNRHPVGNEPYEFSVREGDPNRRVLGVLAFLSNLDANCNVLIVEGDSMAGTEAIRDFLFDDSALLPFLNKVRKTDGTLSHFEVLLESSNVNGSAGPFHILAYRTHP
jgi:hypothetical protein